jgi:hypothetical protein
MGNILSSDWQYSTVVVRSDSELGTGVLVSKANPVPSQQHGIPQDPWQATVGPTYLVTARHVLGKTPNDVAKSVSCSIEYNSVSGLLIERRRGEFVFKNDPLNWVMHPDPNVDVAALDLTAFVAEHCDFFYRACPLSEIANPISLLKKDVEIADEVFVLGYPAGLVQGATALPIARRGILASSPRRALIQDNLTRHGFLIDGAIIAGSSGSPVICASEFFRAGDLDVTANRAILLGIVVEEWARTSGTTYAHLGFAQNSLAIMETLLEFNAVSARDFLQLDHDSHWVDGLGLSEWSFDIYEPTVPAFDAVAKMHEARKERLRRSGVRIALGKHIADTEFGIRSDGLF